MKNGCLPICWLCSLWLIGFSSAVSADRHGDGMYAGIELGAFMPQDLDTTGGDNDIPTMCDEYHFGPRLPSGDLIVVGQSPCLRSEDQWRNRFDFGTGVLGGATVGYQRGNMRFELEYFYRAGDGDTESLGFVSGDKQGEFLVDEESFDNFRAHHLLANVYYDFHNGSPFTPYLGVGIGWADTKVDYKANFTRNTRQVFVNNPDLSPRAAAAGTLTKADREFSDELFGYQLMAGVDYAMTDNSSIGAKIRYAEFEELEGGGRWDLLRSHDSKTGRNGDYVTYRIKTDDIEFWAFSVTMKYHF